MSRVGKIARLPEQIREQINCRLQDGQNGRDILAWLNASDEVKAGLAREFEGREINDSNLSAWRQGGYRDWEAQQTALAEARRTVSEGGELAQTGKGALADNLAAWMIGRYIVATRKLLENGDDPEVWKLTREICHDLVALRRGDHGAEWLRIERERLKLQRKKQHSDREKLKQEILKENPPPEVLSDEEKERRWNQIFGISPESHSLYGGRSPFDPTPDPAGPPAPPPEAARPPAVLSVAAAAAKSEAVAAKVGQTDLAPINPIPPIAPISPEEDSEVRELQKVTELAEKGHAYGAYCLGARYRDGCGVPKDLVKAREWLGKAASQGIGSAKIELRALVMRFGD
jgi:hypothetical protein